MLGCVAQGWSKVTNAEPGQRALHAVDKPGAFLDQALALPIGPLGVLFGKCRHAHRAAMAPFAPQPTQEPPLEQLGVEPIGLGPSMFPRHGHTRGMDHVRLDATRRKPARQPEAVAAGLESQRNPRNIATGFDRLIPQAPRPTIVVSRDDLCLMTPSGLSVRHLSSATAERPFTRAGPMVRIRFPPAKSLQTISSSAAEPITADDAKN